jgi:predicted DNA-binding ribbon-helix-helix protein
MGPGGRPALYNCTANCVIYATPQDFCQTALLKDQIFALYRKSTTEWGMCNGGCILMKSPVVKRSVIIGGHKTSVSLEDEFWSSLKEIGGLRFMTLSNLIGSIESRRQHGNLSSAIRLFVLDYYRSRVAPGSDQGLQDMLARSASMHS